MKLWKNFYVLSLLLVVACGFESHLDNASQPRNLTEEQERIVFDKATKIAMQFLEMQTDAQGRLLIKGQEPCTYQTKSFVPYEQTTISSRPDDTYIVYSEVYVDGGDRRCRTDSVFDKNLNLVKIDFAECYVERSGVSAGNR